MAVLPEPNDPTLDAVDSAIELNELSKPRRQYLGMSSIGEECERKLWYGFRQVCVVKFDAKSIKRFEDGHYGEEVQIKRLRMVPGTTLLSHDPETGRQFAYSDHGCHFRGHADGLIEGLLQAPKTWHVYEHKQVSKEKQKKLEKLKEELGEKSALKAWDETYYAQAQLYMHYSGHHRHYLTCSSPGGRHTVSCRTDYVKDDALRQIAKAERIIFGERPPPKISDDPAWFRCRWCDFSSVCHEAAPIDRNCRTCAFVTPERDGGWSCIKHDVLAPCADHRFIPALVPGEQIDAAEDGSWIEYRINGEIWRDE
jgi:hypothetical protein